MKTIKSLCTFLIAAMLLSACSSMPRVTNRGVGVVTVAQARKADVIRAAKNAFAQQDYTQISSDKNSVVFQKPATAFRAVNISIPENSTSVRVKVSIATIPDTKNLQIEQTPYQVTSAGVSEFPNPLYGLTLWNLELGRILSQIAQQSSVQH